MRQNISVKNNLKENGMMALTAGFIIIGMIVSPQFAAFVHGTIKVLLSIITAIPIF